MFFIAVYARSKWPTVIEMPSITAQRTSAEVLQLLSLFGLPQQAVTDNGPTFVPEDF